MDFGRVRRGELLKKVIVLENIPVPYELQYKNVKRINLRVHRDGRVCVSAGHFVPQRQIDTFLTQNSGFILQTLERFRKMREAGDGMAAGKNRIYEDGDILYLGLPDEFLDEFLFHRVEVFGSDLDVISLPAVAGLEESLIIAELYDSVVIDECFLKRFRHRFQLLFGER